DKAELDPFPGCPEQAGEQVRIVLQLGGAALLDQVDEGLVDLQLNGLEAFDVFLLLRLEGIEQRLVLPGRMYAPLDADLLQKLGESEGCGYDTEGDDYGGRIGKDLVARHHEHISTGSR